MSIELQDQYLGFLIDPSFQRVNRLLALLLIIIENKGDRIVPKSTMLWLMDKSGS